MSERSDFLAAIQQDDPEAWKGLVSVGAVLHKAEQDVDVERLASRFAMLEFELQMARWSETSQRQKAAA